MTTFCEDFCFVVIVIEFLKKSYFYLKAQIVILVTMILDASVKVYDIKFVDTLFYLDSIIVLFSGEIFNTS
jgi:hypothetical protein